MSRIGKRSLHTHVPRRLLAWHVSRNSIAGLTAALVLLSFRLQVMRLSSVVITELPWDYATNSTVIRPAGHLSSVTFPNPENQVVLSPLLEAPKQTLTEPWHIVDQYIAWHSQESLRQKPLHDNNNRSYAIAFYSCPLQIGNRWHHFLNSFLWSIVTNRTLLWNYWDPETCDHYGGPYDGRICSAANQVEDCDPYLERESWMESYQHWKKNASSRNDVHVKQLSYWSTHSSHASPGRGVLPYNQSKHHELKVDALHNQWPIVVFPQMLGTSHTLGNELTRQELLATEWARQTAEILYQHGTPFLYGLLFHAAFALTQPLTDNTTAMILRNAHYSNHLVPTDNSTRKDGGVDDDDKSNPNCSIAVHSRHTDVTILGDDVDDEIRCIESLWRRYGRKNQYSSCDLYIMADRAHTLRGIVEWCFRQHPHNASFPCRQVVLAERRHGTSFVPEHGPFAGLGFLEDLVVVGQSAPTSIGIVGGKRSSTSLLVEWMEYDRFLDAYENMAETDTLKDVLPEPLPKCILRR